MSATVTLNAFLPEWVGLKAHELRDADPKRLAAALMFSACDKMSNDCGPCACDRRKRVGPDARRFTTLYWAFLDRHQERFGRNARVARQVHAGQRLGDLPEVRVRADDVLAALDAGTL